MCVFFIIFTNKKYNLFEYFLIIDFFKNGKLAAGRRRKFMWLAVILLFLVNEYAGAVAVLAVVVITLITSLNNSKRN